MSCFSKLVRPLRLDYGLLLLIAGVALVLPSCDWDGNFTVLGYTTASQFDRNYKTIRVPIFQNLTFYRGLEFDLTKAIVTEVERRTHMKVVSGDADLELTGKVMSFNKSETLAGPINTVRNADTVLVVEVVLKDLRTGKILSKPPRRPGGNPAEEIPLLNTGNVPGLNTPILATPAAPGGADQQQAIMTAPPGSVLPDTPGTPGNAITPSLPGSPSATLGPDGATDPNKKPAGFVIRATANFIPEVGQSITTAEQRCVLNMATQIVNMMEMGW
jgi:Lipopolysaccharide-assembly